MRYVSLCRLSSSNVGSLAVSVSFFSVLIVLFFVLLAVMECYANGVLMSFLGSGALFVVAPDVHPLYLAPLTVSVSVCVLAGCEGLLPTVLRTFGRLEKKLPING